MQPRFQNQAVYGYTKGLPCSCPPVRAENQLTNHCSPDDSPTSYCISQRVSSGPPPQVTAENQFTNPSVSDDWQILCFLFWCVEKLGAGSSVRSCPSTAESKLRPLTAGRGRRWGAGWGAGGGPVGGRIFGCLGKLGPGLGVCSGPPMPASRAMFQKAGPPCLRAPAAGQLEAQPGAH